MPRPIHGSRHGPAALVALAGRWARMALGLLLIAMVLLNVANALSRYLLGQAIEGSDELLVFGMVWVVFVGSAFATADRRHLSFDVVSRSLPPRAGRLVQLSGTLITILVLGFVVIQSLDVVVRLAALGQRSMAAAIPTYIPHSAILVGFGLSALILLAELLRGVAAALRNVPSTQGEGPR
jgi:TRAP-type C4-dicarboxylate transport system permease small subunit